VDGLDAPSVQNIVESLQACGALPLHALQVMKLSDARHFGFHGVARSQVRCSAFGERDGDENLIGKRSLRLSSRARGRFGAHSNFRASAAGVASRKHEFTRNVADRSAGNGLGFSFASGRKKQRGRDHQNGNEVLRGKNGKGLAEPLRSAPHTSGGLLNLRAFQKFETFVVNRIV
jgi:hypothetical protein